MIKLAIDAMGGDHAPESIVKGVNLAVKELNDVEFILFGDEMQIKQFLIPNERVKIIHAPNKIEMGEKDPIGEVRRNKDTSLVQTFQAVRDKVADGAVTAGPTQATVVAAHLLVKRIKGMKRVALCPVLPKIGGKHRLLLDVGANIELRSEHIVQLAQYATIYMRETMGLEKPLVGLLNIGSEPGKGREVDKETFTLLSHDPNVHFFGNIEPKELLSSECDIYVTDGYTGNMVMKTAEGTAKAMASFLKEDIKKGFLSKIGYLFMKRVFRNLKKSLNADEVGGASVFGIDGIVVKAHGASTDYAFYNAIKQARLAVKGEVVEKMKAVIGEIIEAE